MRLSSGPAPSRSAEPAWKAEARNRRDHEVKRVARIAAVGPGITERTDQVGELDDRRRVPVVDQQRQRVRLGERTCR